VLTTIALAVASCAFAGVSTAAADLYNPPPVQNAETGLCLATTRQQYFGAPVIQMTCDGSKRAWWTWSYVDPRYGGTYDSLVSSYVPDPLCARSAPGSLDVGLYDCPGSFYVKRFVYGPNSRWFQIYNREAGTCLAVNSYANETRVFEWWCIDGNNAEVWRQY